MRGPIVAVFSGCMEIINPGLPLVKTEALLGRRSGSRNLPFS